MTRVVPKHVAMIMDGNGRWAEERGLDRIEGHKAGAKVVRDVTTYCREIGVRYLTLYAFSSENWGRPEREVGGLMQLLGEYLNEERPTLLKNQIELRTIGATERLPLLVRTLLGAVSEATKGLPGMRLTLALSYGSRDEIVRAAKKLAEDVKSGKMRAADIDENAINARLDTADMPDPDLLVRTSGEKRISNFLLWQLAYTELFITDVPWPDFTRAHVDEAFASYANRQRRFGLTGAQLSSSSSSTSAQAHVKGPK
jgi:undecaprenyl diphosphate synthase